LMVARDCNQLEHFRHPLHPMALKKMFSADSIGCAYDGARASPDMFDHPLADNFVVVREIELRYGLPSPASGHIGLSGCEIAIPITVALAPVFNFGDSNVWKLVFFGTGLAILTCSAGAGSSATTSEAGLSWRNPLNAPARTMPSSVHPANSISATIEASASEYPF